MQRIVNGYAVHNYDSKGNIDSTEFVESDEEEIWEDGCGNSIDDPGFKTHDVVIGRPSDIIIDAGEDHGLVMNDIRLRALRVLRMIYNIALTPPEGWVPSDVDADTAYDLKYDYLKVVERVGANLEALEDYIETTIFNKYV